MSFSYTQIAQYLRCPRSYRYRYLDGWREKENRASLLFGRAFEKALAAYFAGEDSAAALFKQWGAHQGAQVEYSKETIGSACFVKGCSSSNGWPRGPNPYQPASMQHAGQARSFPFRRERLRAYLDAVGRSTASPPCSNGRPPQLVSGGTRRSLALDPQLICYS